MVTEHIKKMCEAALESHRMFIDAASDAIKDFIREDGVYDKKSGVWSIEATMTDDGDDGPPFFGMRIVRNDDETIDGHEIESIDMKPLIDRPWVVADGYDHVMEDITDTDIVEIVKALEKNHERKDEK